MVERHSAGGDSRHPNGGFGLRRYAWGGLGALFHRAAQQPGGGFGVDPQAAFEYGALIGRELRAEGYSMSLGGGVNLSREPRNGRTFEYQGEDPLLAGTLVGNFVKGVQSEHISAT